MINYVPLFQQQRKISLADTFNHFSQHLIDSIYVLRKEKKKWKKNNTKKKISKYLPENLIRKSFHLSEKLLWYNHLFVLVIYFVWNLTRVVNQVNSCYTFIRLYLLRGVNVAENKFEYHYYCNHFEILWGFIYGDMTRPFVGILVRIRLY